MILSILVCLSLVDLRPVANEPNRFSACLLVSETAIQEGVDPFLAVALAWNESSMLDRTSRAGAKGFMQVVPKYACKDCDLVQAGCRMLKGWLKSTGGDRLRAVAHYNSGRSIKQSSLGWARYVVGFEKRMKRRCKNAGYIRILASLVRERQYTERLFRYLDEWGFARKPDRTPRDRWSIQGEDAWISEQWGSGSIRPFSY